MDANPSTSSTSAPYPHSVKFYDDDASLGRTVAEFLAPGLLERQPAIVIATASNRLGEVSTHAESIYQRVRSEVETPENVGKMMVIDTQSGDFEIDPQHIPAWRRLQQRQPKGEFFAIRIGYKAAESFSGMLSRREP